MSLTRRMSARDFIGIRLGSGGGDDPRPTLSRLPQKLRQFSNVGGNPPCLVPLQQFRRRAPAGLILEIDIRELLPRRRRLRRSTLLIPRQTRSAGSGGGRASTKRFLCAGRWSNPALSNLRAQMTVRGEFAKCCHRRCQKEFLP